MMLFCLYHLAGSVLDPQGCEGPLERQMEIHRSKVIVETPDIVLRILDYLPTMKL